MSLQTGPGIVKKLLKIAYETNDPKMVGTAEMFNTELSNYIRNRRVLASQRDLFDYIK
jgi:hypothetical protein